MVIIIWTRVRRYHGTDYLNRALESLESSTGTAILKNQKNRRLATVHTYCRNEVRARPVNVIFTTSHQDSPVS